MDLRRVLRCASVLFLVISLLLVSLAFLFVLSTHSSFDCARDCNTCLNLAYLQRILRMLSGGLFPLLGSLFLLLFSLMTAGVFFKAWPAVSLVERKSRMNN